METHFRNSFISLSNVNVVCRHLLFNFQSLFMKCMVRIINESMLMLDHISVLAEKKSLSCSSAMMIYLIFLNNWGMTLTFVLLGNSYCLSNDWSFPWRQVSPQCGAAHSRPPNTMPHFSLTSSIYRCLVSIWPVLRRPLWYQPDQLGFCIHRSLKISLEQTWMGDMTGDGSWDLKCSPSSHFQAWI